MLLLHMAGETPAYVPLSGLIVKEFRLLIDVPIEIEPRASSDRPRVLGVLDHEVFAPFGPSILPPPIWPRSRIVCRKRSSHR